MLNIKNIRIAKFNGGSKINVIPSSATAIIETNEDVKKIINVFQNKISNINVEIIKIKEELKLLSENETTKFLNSIVDFKHGVINKNKRHEVTTSQNLSIVDLSKNLIQIGLRSSIKEEEINAINDIKKYCARYNYKFKQVGYQPGFNTDEKSELVKKMKESYYKINNKYPELKSVHIAVEVGLIKEKMKDIEVVIISPEIIDAHTIRERVKISSIVECDKWLHEYLKTL